MEISFKQVVVAETAETAWFVLVDDIVVGQVERREQAGLNQVKDFRYSGSGYNGRTRRARLWDASVYCVGLDSHERLRIKRHITRQKTDRMSAAVRLIEAYSKAGVPLPGNESDYLAA
jgi:hypothetical protein